MSRQIDSTLAAGLASANIQPIILVALTFTSGVAYAWSGVGPLYWNGNTYLGVGSLGQVSAITEGTSVEAHGMTVTLSGIPIGGVPQIVQVSGQCAPWLTSDTLNTAYTVDGINGGLPPVSIPVTPGGAVTISYLGGLASISHPIGDIEGAGQGNSYGSWDANGNPTVSGNSSGEAGQYVETACNDQCLLASWADDTGQLIQAPFAPGYNSGTLTVPTGAAQLLFGMNDGTDWADNSGAWTLQITNSDGATNPGSNMLTECLQDIQLGASAKVWFGLFQNGQVLGTPYLAFGGTVDQPSIKVGTDTIAISLALENRLSNLQRASQQRYTAASQQLIYPDDIAFNWVEQLNDEALLWG